MPPLGLAVGMRVDTWKSANNIVVRSGEWCPFASLENVFTFFYEERSIARVQGEVTARI